MVNEIMVKNSMKATLRQTDVWKDDTCKFKLNGSGASVEQKSWRSKSPSFSLGGQKHNNYGHIPTTTVRDADLFS